MIGTSANYKAQINNSPYPFSGCIFWRNGSVIEETYRFGFADTKAGLAYYNGTYWGTNKPAPPKIRLLDGSVTSDRSQPIQGNARLTFLDTTGTGAGQSLLDPVSANEIQIYRGIKINNPLLPPNFSSLDDWEAIKLGWFTVSDLQITRYGDALVYEATLQDRGWRIDNNPWRVAYSINQITNNAVQMIKAIVTDRAKGFTPQFDVLTASTYTTPTAQNWDRSTPPWSGAVQNLAVSAQLEVFFDWRGVCVIRDVVDPLNATPVAIYSKDSEVLLQPPQRAVPGDEIFNGVVVRGTAGWLLFPIVGEAWDDDPASPTWRLGQFGERPKNIDNAQVGTDAAATAIAVTEFGKIKGVWEDMSFQVMPDASLETGDVVRVDDLALGVQQKLVIEQRVLPLVQGAMTTKSRRRR